MPRTRLARSMNNWGGSTGARLDPGFVALSDEVRARLRSSRLTGSVFSHATLEQTEVLGFTASQLQLNSPR